MRLIHSDLVRRFVIPAFLVVFANLAALGLLIGYDGASRAYAVGLNTLFGDNLPAVIAAGLLALVLAAAFGRRLGSMSDLGRFLVWVLVADLAAGLVPIVAVNEMATYPNVPRILATETAGGTQLVAVAIGLLLGHRVRTKD